MITRMRIKIDALSGLLMGVILLTAGAASAGLLLLAVLGLLGRRAGNR
jgi:hypothetical protein